MKNLVLIICLIIFTSCSTSTYDEYDVVNHSSKKIMVEITTYGGDLQEFLSYEINPGKWEHIFEHPDYQDTSQNMDKFLKYIKQIEIYDMSNDSEVVKKFTSSNMKISYKDGFFGHYINHEFIINDSDFE